MNQESRPVLSIVIPAYNEGAPDRLPQSLEAIVPFVEAQDFPIEVIIVNNNSTDNTREIAEEASARYPFIQTVTENAQGKGAAVRTGMLHATGDLLFFCDADLSMPIEEVMKFMPDQVGDFDIAIASREAPGAKRVGEPEMRHLMGRVFNLIVQVIAVRNLSDTQCGFKMFRREAAEKIFPLQTIDGWGFDVELMFIAQRLGMNIVEIPITWIYKSHSKIKPVQDSINMVLETLKIRRNGWRGIYNGHETTR